MSLQDQIAIDNDAVFFNSSEFGKTASLNGSSVVVIVHEVEQDESGPGAVELIKVEFQNSDYSTITYRTDTLIIDGETWSYPKLISKDPYSSTKIVQFRRNERLGNPR